MKAQGRGVLKIGIKCGSREQMNMSDGPTEAKITSEKELGQNIIMKMAFRNRN